MHYHAYYIGGVLVLLFYIIIYIRIYELTNANTNTVKYIRVRDDKKGNELTTVRVEQ